MEFLTAEADKDGKQQRRKSGRKYSLIQFTNKYQMFNFNYKKYITWDAKVPVYNGHYERVNV